MINHPNRSKSDRKSPVIEGLRRLALVQLGSRDHLDDREFAKRVAVLAIRTSVPIALRAAASVHKNPVHQKALRDAANRCEQEPTESNVLEARSVAQQAYSAAGAKNSASDKSLAEFAEGVVRILIEMKVPGVQWLQLTEVAA